MIPDLPLELQRLILIEASGPPSSDPNQFDLDRSRRLVVLSLVNRDWKDIAYPLLWSSVTYTRPYDVPLDLDHEGDLLVKTLRLHPELARLVVSLRMESYDWTAADFALLPNLRNYMGPPIGTTKAHILPPLESRPKLWSLDLDYLWNGGIEDVHGRWEESLERVFDPSELRSLHLRPSFDFDASSSTLLNIFPSTPSLPHLTSLTLTQDLLPIQDLAQPCGYFLPLLERVGNQLTDLAILESDEFAHWIDLPSWIFDLCPNLTCFSVRGCIGLNQLTERGHEGVREIEVGGDMWAGNEEANVELVLEAGVEGRFPKMEKLRLMEVSFKEEERGEDEDLALVWDGFCEKVGREMSKWVVVDRDGDRWEGRASSASST